MFNSITIDNFRGIKHLQLDGLKQVNLFVGGNNSGKTSVMEAVYWVAGASNPLIYFQMYSRRHPISSKNKLDLWGTFFHKYDHKNICRINVVEDKNSFRKVTIEPLFQNKSVSIDSLETSNSQTLDMKSLSDGVSQLDSINGLNLIWEKDNKSGKATISYNEKSGKFDIHGEDKSFIKFTSFTPPYSSLDQIFSAIFQDLHTSKKTHLLKEICKKIASEIQDISMGPDQILRADVGLSDYQPPFGNLGAGIARVISILAYLINAKDGILIVDEIENGLYPDTLKILWEAIFLAAKEFNVQVFATTHSMDCLKAVSEVFSEEKDDKLSVFKLHKKEDETLQVSYTLDEFKNALNVGWDIR